MNIELIKIPTQDDWRLCRMAALNTIWKSGGDEPSEDWKRKILKAGHSPIRVLTFYIRMKDIPYCDAMHLTRHVHAVPFVSSQRNDRQDRYDRRKAPQDAPVNMDWFVNAEELITVAHKRLCRQASAETRAIVAEICRQVLAVCPEFDGLLVPLCVYRNGLCTEFKPCGRWEE